VQTARAGGNNGESLDGDVAFAKPRDIDVTARAALQEISLPEQAVGMEIGNDELFMQRLSRGGCVVGWRWQDAVHPVFNGAWHHKPCDRNRGDKKEEYPAQKSHARRLSEPRAILNRSPSCPKYSQCARPLPSWFLTAPA